MNYYQKLETAYLRENPDNFRFGSILDGGYFLDPKIIGKIDVMVSGGVSSNVEFENDLFRFNKELKIVMIDPTVSKLKLLSKAVLRIFFLKKKKLRYLSNTLLFIQMLRSGRVWHIKEWMSSKFGIFDSLKAAGISNPNPTILLKLDIEGAEYDLLDEITENLNAFECMVFEFHELDKKQEEFLAFIESCSAQFDLTHLEINPSGGFFGDRVPKNIELTLQRRNDR